MILHFHEFILDPKSLSTRVHRPLILQLAEKLVDSGARYLKRTLEMLKMHVVT